MVDEAQLSGCPQCKEPVVWPEQGSDEVRYCPRCRLPLVQVAGKYRLEKQLAEGGCGVLYLARHQRLKMEPIRVIKFLKPELFEQQNAGKRFAYEVEITSAISQRNEHIVRIYDDFGELGKLGHYYVMEFLQGETLAQLLKRRQDLELGVVLHIFRQLCKAIQEAHSAKVVHRDLKPDNIFLIERSKDPYFVKVIDFGIAKAFAQGQVTSMTQGVIGTPEYMSPEQCTANPVDHRSDIYSMGIIFFELLVGYTPFLNPDTEQEASLMSLVFAQISQPVEPPSQVRPDRGIPPELDEFVLRMVHKDPEQRFQSIEDMLQRLDQIELLVSGVSQGVRLEVGADAQGLASGEFNAPRSKTSPGARGQQGVDSHIAVGLHDSSPRRTASFGEQESEAGVHTLEPREQQQGITKREQRSQVPGHDSLPLSSGEPKYTQEIQRGGPPWGLIGGVLVLLLLLGGAGIWWSRRPIAKPAPRPPARKTVQARIVRKAPPKKVAQKAPAPKRAPVVPPRRPAKVAKRPVKVARVGRRRRRSRRRRRPRVVVVRTRPAPVRIQKAPSTPGCPHDTGKGRWIRVDIATAGTEPKTNMRYMKSKRGGRSFCFLWKSGKHMNFTKPGYAPCLFLQRPKKRIIRIRLQKDGETLDSGGAYCVY